jgi:circadian clock protein KaiC
VLESGQVDILFLPREQLHAARFLSVVESRISSLRPARVVLDSASDIEVLGLVSEELRQLLYALVLRLRHLGVTSLFTLEARSLVFSDIISERGLSPLADNIFMLRYLEEQGQLVPALRVVKTRGSTHDRGIHRLLVGEGGLRLGGPGEAAPPPSRKAPKKGRRLGGPKRGKRT